MPIGLGVPDGEVSPGVARWEAVANGDPGPAQGRELEIAELLGYLRAQQVRNFVFLTADVHYCAAHHYHPDRAAFQDFEPFWEFVAGPLNAGSFGPNPLDKTFGPEVVFEKAPPAQNTSPFAGFQFFGEVNIEGQSGEMSVVLRDLNGVGGVRAKTAASLRHSPHPLEERPQACVSTERPIDYGFGKAVAGWRTSQASPISPLPPGRLGEGLSRHPGDIDPAQSSAPPQLAPSTSLST